MPLPNRQDAMNMAFNFIYKSDIIGDYYEFGCFEGQSLIHSLGANEKLRKRYDKNCVHKFFAFDSFGGLPELSPDDKLEDYELVWPGQFACTREKLEKNITSAGYDPSTISFIEGFYDQSLQNVNALQKTDNSKAAIIHIDCDLYSSAQSCLKFMSNRMTDGSLLLFDDWLLYRGRPDRGVQKAFNEWQGSTGYIFNEYFKYSWAGICFICNSVTSNP